MTIAPSPLSSGLPMTGPAAGRRRLRASIYVRLSNAADDANTSKENMIAECRALLARENFEEVALHVDDGLSGGIRNRPEFAAWLDDARYQRCEVLVAHHVDRMTREGLNVAAMILDVQEGKDPTTGQVVRPPVRLMDTKGVDSNGGVAFRMMFLIKAEAAREERERIRERMAGRATRLRLAGRWPGGTPPFGYEVVPAPDGKGRTLALVPEEAAALRECADRLLAGDAIARTVRWLNHNGPKPRRAPEWSRVTLKDALTGDHLLGRVTVGGVVQRDDQGHALTPFPAVLDLVTLVELRKLLAPGRERKTPLGRKPARLASRLIECGSCGSYLQVVRREGYRTAAEDAQGRAGRGALIAYRCHARSEGRTCERAVIVSALPFEAHLEERFLIDFGHAPMIERRVILPDDGALVAVEESLAAVLADLARAATPETFTRLQALQAERARLADLPREPVVTYVATGRTMAEEWHARDLEGKRELLAEAYELLRVGPGKRGRKGFDPARLTAIPAEGVHDPD
ncbi:DNA invertase Pin-like site-specific DNA recombinase [Micromonospora sp. M71_S20]|uniref:recombinase family protein n=1 Tax=Micromonospora sp. M71_S20 TaxID=592872 RepID=UPI000EAF1602|nr:recombinase family protein [Micromonospora sp. M71_S20]RLK22616.1 DNA invertase Pin-like site-specific DNA recombinase [Micromonospora sp. M71_S20]